MSINLFILLHIDHISTARIPTMSHLIGLSPVPDPLTHPP